jgi:hypothetical protein
VIEESDKKEIQRLQRQIVEKQTSVAQTRKHIRKAVEQLQAAEGSFHKDLPRWLEVQSTIAKLKEFEVTLLDNERALGSLAIQLVNPIGKTISTSAVTGWTSVALLDSSTIETQKNSRSSGAYVYTFKGMKATDIDYPFIAALDECLPSAPNGKRSRFGRDRVIQKVFELVHDQCTRTRITVARKRIRDELAAVSVKKR